jgi:two-component system, sensor histidine kinase and response regulator
LVKSDLNCEQRAYIETVQSCSESLMVVMNDILDMAALEAGKVAIENASFDLRAFMQEAMVSYKPLADKRKLRLTVAIGAKVPSQIRCDRKRLKQLVENLLANAIKFTDEGEVVVEVDRAPLPNGLQQVTPPDRLSAQRASGKLIFSVRDSGIGVSEEQQTIIFDPFSQADASGRRGCEGVGLGLAISKQLIELMGGEIGVESVIGGGSHFWFTLPLQPVAP